MMTSGSQMSAKDALAVGLVDEVVDGDLRAGAVAFARKVASEGRPLQRVRDRNEKVEAARGKPEIFEQFRKANARKFRGFMAPRATSRPSRRR
jgi:3-hydroxyacyl-CoA dehydrogenase